MKSISTDPEAAKKFQEFLAQQQSFYAGILDRVPEAFRADLQKLKDGIDAKLKAMADKPTDQVPAAGSASSALEQMALSLSWMQEMYDSATKGLNDLMSRVAPKEQALQALQSRVAAGELIEKAAAEEATRDAVKTAVEEALKTERSVVARLSSRRQVLASASLPTPTDEAILSGEDSEFEARKTSAKTRLDKLASLGLSQQLESAEVAELIYGGEREFERFVKIAGRGRPNAEPLAGGSQSAKTPLRGY